MEWDIELKKDALQQKDVAERPNAKARERPSPSFLDESLILAQDERWRRA